MNPIAKTTQKNAIYIEPTKKGIRLEGCYERTGLITLGEFDVLEAQKLVNAVQAAIDEHPRTVEAKTFEAALHRPALRLNRGTP